MSIYRRTFDFEFAWEKGKPLVLLLIVALAILLMAGGYIALSFLEPPVLRAELQPDAIPNSAHTLLAITILNPGETDVAAVEVYVHAADPSSIDVSPSKTVIPILEKNGGSRHMTALVNPVGTVLPGLYTIRVEAVLENTVYDTEVTLEITR